MVKLIINSRQATDPEFETNIENCVDLILAAMGIEEEAEQLTKKDGSLIYYFFRTTKRKRQGQLVKFCLRYLPTEIMFKAEGITRAESFHRILELRKNPNFIETTKKQTYDGDDIKVLDDYKNWKPWQREIFHKFFHKDLRIRKPEERTIHSLVDTEGCSRQINLLQMVNGKHR